MKNVISMHNRNHLTLCFHLLGFSHCFCLADPFYLISAFHFLCNAFLLHNLLREMAGSPQLMCIHNVKHDWFSDSAVPHNTRHIALHDIVFRTSYDVDRLKLTFRSSITIQPCFLAVYACQMPLPASSQDSLLSGWLNLG